MNTPNVIKNVLFARLFDGQSSLGTSLPTKHAAAYLGVGQGMIYNFIRWGYFKAVRADRRIWISFDSVKELHGKQAMNRVNDLQRARGGKS